MKIASLRLAGIVAAAATLPAWAEEQALGTEETAGAKDPAAVEFIDENHRALHEEYRTGLAVCDNKYGKELSKLDTGYMSALEALLEKLERFRVVTAIDIVKLEIARVDMGAVRRSVHLLRRTRQGKRTARNLRNRPRKSREEESQQAYRRLAALRPGASENREIPDHERPDREGTGRQDNPAEPPETGRESRTAHGGDHPASLSTGEDEARAREGSTLEEDLAKGRPRATADSKDPPGPKFPILLPSHPWDSRNSNPSGPRNSLWRGNGLGPRPERGADGYPVLMRSLRAGEVDEIDPDKILSWGHVSAQSFGGKKYWAVNFIFTANTLFGLQECGGTALVRDGKVVKWVYTVSGRPIR